MNIKKVISFFITIFMLQHGVSAAFWDKNTSTDLGNEITKEEFPESADVEPKPESETDLVIKGGIEEINDVTLDECIRLALGNNPRIQAAMQDVFAADARLKQTWSAFFPQFSWQTGYTRIRQLQLSDVFRENLVYNYY